MKGVDTNMSMDFGKDINGDLEAMGFGKHDKYHTINRFGYGETGGISSTTEYLFFTKPDLNMLESGGMNIVSELQADPFINDLFRRDSRVLHQLQKSANPSSGSFMVLLNNSVRSKLDIPTISSKQIETSANLFGTKMSYSKHSFESDEDHEFSLDFEDDKTTPVYNLFKLWDYYMSLKAIGVAVPQDHYRDSKIIHDQISIFKIVVDETMMNILYIAKVIGCYPIGVPRDFFSDISDKLLYSVSFKANFVDDNTPLIINDFNNLSSNTVGGSLPLFSTENNRPDGRWAKGAYIEKYDYGNKPGHGYRLKWRL